MQFMTVV